MTNAPQTSRLAREAVARPTDRVIRARFVTFQTNEDRRGSSLPDGDFFAEQEREAPIFATSATICRTLCRRPARSFLRILLPSLLPSLSGRCQYLSHGRTGKERNNGHFCILNRRCERAPARGARLSRTRTAPLSREKLRWRLKLYPLLRGRWTLSRSTIYLGVLHPPHA